jgi:hypothetical protein
MGGGLLAARGSEGWFAGLIDESGEAVTVTQLIFSRLLTVTARIAGAFFLTACLLQAQPKRIVILKVDGLNQDLLERGVNEIDPNTGKSALPWIKHVFFDGGTVFHNFYSRGISLSAPSWSILDTGHHPIIRGNVEFDRYTGKSFDYLNFFPFYVGYARNREVDMPGVEVLDRAGIPLLIDSFPPAESYQSFQLFQRGVRWETLSQVLQRRFSTSAIIATVEEAGVPSYESLLETQTDAELAAGIAGSQLLYLDFYDGGVDHEGHATSQVEALMATLRGVDARVGRLWTEIQKSPLAKDTVFAMVSDHGMNNVPGVISQTYSITDLLSSPAGGGHHIVTDRQQLSDFKLKALDPLVTRVITPSKASFYLADEADRYPTAWIDIDGNERTSVGLRNNDLNKIHILLKQLARKNLPAPERQAAAAYVHSLIDKNRDAWSKIERELTEELKLVSELSVPRQQMVSKLKMDPAGKDDVSDQYRINRRLRKQLEDWQDEVSGYTDYLQHLRRLLAYSPDSEAPLRDKIDSFLPSLAQGDNNSVGQIQHYVVGLSPVGIALDGDGHLDEERTFRHVNYPRLLVSQRAHNVPQKELSSQPIDFVAAVLPDSQPDKHAYWLYGSDQKQLIIETNSEDQIRLRPVSNLDQPDAGAPVTSEDISWQPGLPLALFEDPNLHVPDGAGKAAWLSSWHTEREWMNAIHQCRYSTGVIGIIEELSPIAPDVPGKPGMDPIMLRYEKRRRTLVETDFHIFAADHWNFNVRFPNPGGNHGGFFRISTHAVWAVAGEGIPIRAVQEPYDGLDFASTMLSILGKPVPLVDRVVHLQ